MIHPYVILPGAFIILIPSLLAILLPDILRWTEYSGAYPLLMVLCLIGYFSYFLVLNSKARKYTANITLKSAEHRVIEHLTFSVLCPGATAAFVLMLVLYYLLFGINNFTANATNESSIDELQMKTAVLLAGIIAYSSILTFLQIKTSKKYPHFLARCYALLSEKSQNITDRLYYFVECLEAYNSFLQRNFKIRINGLGRLYSILASIPAKNQKDIIEKIDQLFHNDQSNIDELSPLREIKESSKAKYQTEFTMGPGTKRKTEDWIQLIGVVVSLLGATVGLLTGLFGG